MSFGHQSQDICYFCTEQWTKVKNKKDENVQHELESKLNLHQKCV